MVAQVIKNQIEKIEYREKTIFFTLLSIFIFLLISYGFFVNSAIVHAISKEKMDNEIISLNSKVNSMEFEYLNMKNGITIDLALSRGFINSSKENFALISDTKNTLSLSVNKN